MSDESPQKGWDSWFGDPPGSSGDEQWTPEQAGPTAPAVSAQETQVASPRQERRSGAPAAVPGPMASPESAPKESPRSESLTPDSPTSDSLTPESVPPPPETEAEQTNWTVPSLGSVLEGRDPFATQVVPPSSAAVPPPRYAGQSQAPEQEQARDQELEPDQGQDHWRSPSPDSGEDQVPTQYSPRNPDPFSDRKPAGYSSTPQVPESNADQIPTQYAPRIPGSSFDLGPDQEPTQYSPQIPGQYPGPEQTVTAPTPAPDAPSWPTPQPAQMWSAAPNAATADYPQTPSAAAQQPPQEPDVPAEWADWDQPERRRPSPAPAVGNGGTGAGGGDRDRDRHGDGAGARPHPRSRKKLAVVGGLGAAAIVGLVAVLVVNQGGLPGTKAAPKPPSGFQPSGTSPASDAQQTGAAFLAAWQSGDFQRAADYTDDPKAALTALTAYKSGLNLAGLQLTAQTATANPTANAAAGASTASATSTASSGTAPGTVSGTVPFAVAAKVGLPAAAAASAGASTSSTSSASSTPTTPTTASTGSSGAASTGSAGTAADVTANWSYSSKLTAYEKNGGWWVQWVPALVAPNLTATEKVVSVAIPPTASKVTDASGDDLADATDPGVRNIGAALKKSAPTGQGTPGVEIELADAAGTPIANTADVLSQPVATGAVKTTIDPTVESAAQSAVLKYTDSSMVVLRPSTGAILAVANNDGGNDFALTARVAPGSTNKIITSTALLTSGLVSSPSQQVACPKSITVNGNTFANSENESEPASTPFLTDFAVSCNNAFGQWYDKIGATTLAQTAEKYYGLNQQWNIGLGAAGPYYTIPSSASNGELFQELFGQGQLEAAPLAMASVAATVDSGSFKQPIVVPGAAQVSATPLPSGVQQDLWQMMKAVVSDGSGTAYGVFSGVNSTVYGKTGTADVGAGGTKQQNPNSWMVVFDPSMDIAIGCVVLNAGYGASFAGPETAAVLKALQ